MDNIPQTYIRRKEKGKMKRTIRRHKNGRVEEEESTKDGTLHRTEDRSKTRQDGLIKNDLTMRQCYSNYTILILILQLKYLLTIN